MPLRGASLHVYSIDPESSDGIFSAQGHRHRQPARQGGERGEGEIV